LIIVAFIANLTKSRGTNQMIFCPGHIRTHGMNRWKENLTQTQTMPIQLPEIFSMFVNPQFAKPAMSKETSCARQNAPINAYNGCSIKKNP
jgi:hypothetical protein